MKDFSVAIDPYRLDEEWVGQPTLYHEYAVLAADARRVYDEEKNTMEVVRAELYQEITADPAKFGMQKSTEEAVKSAIAAHIAYRSQAKKVIEAKHTVSVMEAAVSALDQRKKALEKLVDLHLADYYSAPKARGEAGNFVENTRQKRTVERLSGTRSTKKKHG